MTDHERDVRVAVQIALLGEISPNLRAVTMRIKDRSIIVDCFFHGEITPRDKESMEDAETEILAGYSETHEVSFELHRLDYPAPIPADRPWAYYRREEVP